MIQERIIFITEQDRQRLSAMLAGARRWSRRDREHLDSLAEELDRAEEVAPEELPRDVITMNTRARIRDLSSNEEMVVTLVYPAGADIDSGRISILAPIGMALLGYRTGDVVEWEVRAGKKRFKVEEVLYQPEAAGDYHP